MSNEFPESTQNANDKAPERSRASLDEKMSKDEKEAFYDFYSDRALAIVLSAILEDRLTSIIRFLMRRDTTIANELFKPTGPLGPFGTKIRLAYMLRIIEHTMYNDMIIVSKIRNKFAHDLSVNSFENRPIKDWVNSMHIFSIVKKMAEDSDALVKAGKSMEAADLIKQHAMISTKDSYRHSLRFMIHHIIDLQNDLEDAEKALNNEHLR